MRSPGTASRANDSSQWPASLVARSDAVDDGENRRPSREEILLLMAAVERQLADLESSAAELTMVEDSLRTCIDQISCSLLPRKLNILDLPDEILLEIFKAMRRPDDPNARFFSAFCHLGVRDVASCRLTC